MVIQMHRIVATDIIRILKRSMIAAPSAVEFIAALEKVVDAGPNAFGASVTVNVYGATPSSRLLDAEPSRPINGLSDDREAPASAGIEEGE